MHNHGFHDDILITFVPHYPLTHSSPCWCPSFSFQCMCRQVSFVRVSYRSTYRTTGTIKFYLYMSNARTHALSCACGVHSVCGCRDAPPRPCICIGQRFTSSIFLYHFAPWFLSLNWALTSPTDLASLSPCLRHWACTCALPCPAFMQILGVQPQVLILVYRASWLQAPVCRPPFPLSPGWPLSKFSHYIILLPECLFSSLRASKQQQLFSLANSDFFRSS